MIGVHRCFSVVGVYRVRRQRSEDKISSVDNRKFSEVLTGRRGWGEVRIRQGNQEIIKARSSIPSGEKQALELACASGLY